MREFREVLSDCDVHDLGFLGVPWTYDNKQVGINNVRVHLDRAVASPEWLTVLPDACVRHLVSSRSDHCPVMLSIRQDMDPKPAQPVRRYEVMWEREPSLTAAVEEAWSRRVGSPDLGGISSAFHSIMGNLYEWKKKNFAPVSRKLDRIREEIEGMADRMDEDSIARQKIAYAEMDELLHREEHVAATISRGLA
jgi:hypothetical protein